VFVFGRCVLVVGFFVFVVVVGRFVFVLKYLFNSNNVVFNSFFNADLVILLLSNKKILLDFDFTTKSYLNMLLYRSHILGFVKPKNLQFLATWFYNAT